MIEYNIEVSHAGSKKGLLLGKENGKEKIWRGSLFDAKILCKEYNAARGMGVKAKPKRRVPLIVMGTFVSSLGTEEYAFNWESPNQKKKFNRLASRCLEQGGTVVTKKVGE